MEPRDNSRRYRKRRKKLSIEMILRRTFVECLKEYVEHTSLPGVRRMCDPDIGLFIRLIWIAVFFTGVGACIYFLIYIWSDMLTKPLIVTLESSTYPISEVDFPAVGICNVNRISMKALQTLAEEEFADLSKGESLEEVKEVLRSLGNLIDFTYNETLRNNPILERFVEKYRENTAEVINIMKNLAPSCKDMILKCSWEGVIVDCESLFTTRRTFSGFCCTFNYILDFEAVTKPKQIAEAKRQREAGSLYGLKVILDPMLSDYAYPVSPIEGFDVLLFSPMHYPEPRAGRVLRRISEPDMAVFLEIKSTKQVATYEVRKYSVATRRCLFHDEVKVVFGNMYSYSTCLVLCRIETIQSLCKCTPFSLATKRYLKDSSVCSLDSLKCLNKYKEKLMYIYPMDTEDTTGLEMEVQDSLFCDDCWPDCEHTEHYTKGYKIPLRTHYYEEKDLKSLFIKDVNMTNKCYVSIYHAVPDSTLDRLDIVYYWFEILSNIGGFSGIIIGFSVFSVVELAFGFVVRLIQIFIKNFRLYR